jgi:crotonobetainyl-CoA:carnitine CoA-transferase CaiB-like acyl-CoA transferase
MNEELSMVARAPLEGLLIVSAEQAVAAPLATCRLADAGARVIKIERPEGDSARGYDRVADGMSSYFAWGNRGKESLVLDYKQAQDAALLEKLLSRADVFVQNIAPGALARAGFGSSDLRKRYPRLITCDISGYGTDNPGSDLKAYDLLVQCESGLVGIGGAPGHPGRIGVSICDIGAGITRLSEFSPRWRNVNAQALAVRFRYPCSTARLTGCPCHTSSSDRVEERLVRRACDIHQSHLTGLSRHETESKS